MTTAHDDRSQVTELLAAWNGGDASVTDRLLSLFYAGLRRQAEAAMRRENEGHTLQPTALVHEAYLRLIDQRRTVWQNRAHFFAVASELMRRILVDHARGRKMAKRSGRWQRLDLTDADMRSHPRDVDLLDLDAALSRLATFDPRHAQIAELRFFGGLSLEETAHVVGRSVATVERDWQAARAWLFTQLKPPPKPTRTTRGDARKPTVAR